MYRKNTASQFLCVQMVLTATGAVGTGLSPAARRCIDGTFAAGGGTFTEDGSTGSYKYAMAQADTNGNDISIIVTATGCIPVCVNFVTTAADPTDSVRLGLTALPNAAAGANGGLPLSVDAAGRVDVLKINGTSQTARDIGASVLLSAGSGTGQLDFTSGVVKANATQWVGGTIPAVNVTGVPLVDLKYTLGTISPAAAGYVGIDWGQVANKTTANVLSGTTIGTLTTYTGNTVQTGDSYARLGAPAGASTAADIAAVNSKTTNLPGSPAAVGSAMTLTSGERSSVADALLDRDMATGADSGSTTVRTVRQALRFLRNKFSISGSTLTVTKEDDSTASWTSVLSTDATAVPVIGSDPAGP